MKAQKTNSVPDTRVTNLGELLHNSERDDMGLENLSSALPEHSATGVDPTVRWIDVAGEVEMVPM